MFAFGSNGYGQIGNNFTGDQATFPQNVLCVGLANENFNTTDFQIFPNPASQFISFKTNKIYKMMAVKVYAISGQLIFERNQITTDNQRIDVSKLPLGIYIAEIMCDNEVIRTKFIKN